MEHSDLISIEELEEQLIRERLKLDEIINSGVLTPNLGEIISTIDKLEKAIERRKL